MYLLSGVERHPIERNKFRFRPEKNCCECLQKYCLIIDHLCEMVHFLGKPFELLFSLLLLCSYCGIVVNFSDNVII